MSVLSLADLLRGMSDACEVCHTKRFTKVVTLVFKPGVRHSHPNCNCATEPLVANLCDGCTDHALECSTGQCEDGERCDVESVTVKTDVEATDEALLPRAIEQNTTPQALRFGMAYRMDGREATTVLEALQASGISVDFSVMRPTIGTRVRTTEGSNRTASEGKSSGELAAESGERSKDGGDSKPTTWPKPLVYLPNDGEIH